MSAFFAGLQLWEKMTFVSPSIANVMNLLTYLSASAVPSYARSLAFMIYCLRVQIVAVFLGLCKNLHTRWTLRKYSTVEGRLLDPTPAMLESQAMNSCEIPFGIRALESGVEVEGVWISRTNTPNPSCPGSPLSSVAASTTSLNIDEPITPSFALMEIDNRTDGIPSYYSPSKRSSESGSTVGWSADRYYGRQV